MSQPSRFFTSKRERKLWFWLTAVVVGIFSTLGLARRFAGILRDQGIIEDAFWVGLWLIGAAILVQGLRMRPRKAEIGIALGVAGAYLILFLRMAIPEERSHLIEYSIVALLIYEVLVERVNNGRHIPAPPLMAFLASSLIGVFDELVQAFLPSRVFDPIDILFNTIASGMAVTGMFLLRWVRNRRDRQ